MRKVLIVEDSGLTRLQLEQLLKKAGYDVFEAVNGQQVIADSFHPEYSLKDMDLVILDLYLEDIYGTEVLKHIVQNYPNLPVIIMSGENKRESIIKCLDLGAKDYILKPYDERIMISRVNRVLPKKDDKDFKKPAEAPEENDFRKFNKIGDLLTGEIDRAIRGKTNLALVRYIFDFDKEETTMEKIYQVSLKKLRNIDLVFRNKNDLILILPFTDEKGERIVYKKLMDFWRKEKYIKKEPRVKRVFFPDDIEKKELIKKYKKVEISNILLNKVSLSIIS